MDEDELRHGSFFSGSDEFSSYGGRVISVKGKANKPSGGFDPRQLFMSYFSYSTARLVKVHSLRVAVLFRLFQLVIIVYIIGWDIIHKKGYQVFDEDATSTVTTKVKGLGYIRYNKSDTFKSRIVKQNNRFVIKENTDGSYMRIFDTADYVIPASEYNTVFVMTNFVEVVQKQDNCEEDLTGTELRSERCEKDSDCMNSHISNLWDGVPTGRCVKSRYNSSVSICELSSWCPTMSEDKASTKNIIQNVGNYTIFIKNSINFKLFNKKESNLQQGLTNKNITECAYYPERKPSCPVFIISEILKKAEPDPYQREMIYMKGGIIEILINWRCNYDAFWDPCHFTYDFNRFDWRYSNKSSSVASGFNFRVSHNYLVNGVMYRTLVKAYGIKFIIVVSGRAGKFSTVPLLITIGSGIGLLSLATLAADYALMSLKREKKVYESKIVYDSEQYNSKGVQVDNESVNLDSELSYPAAPAPPQPQNIFSVRF